MWHSLTWLSFLRSLFLSYFSFFGASASPQPLYLFIPFFLLHYAFFGLLSIFISSIISFVFLKNLLYIFLSILIHFFLFNFILSSFISSVLFSFSFFLLFPFYLISQIINHVLNHIPPLNSFYSFYPHTLLHIFLHFFLLPYLSAMHSQTMFSSFSQFVIFFLFNFPLSFHFCLPLIPLLSLSPFASLFLVANINAETMLQSQSFRAY